MRSKRGKSLPASPRHAHRAAGESRWELYALVALVLFVVGIVAGFAWSLDRQVRGGALAQRVEARQRPDWVRIETLPEYVPQALVAVVDPTFWERSPFDFDAREQTVGEELARQLHRLADNLPGTAREQVMGPLLERRLSRRELLELYLNRIQFGESERWPVYGIYHASREYFGKEPRELTPAEAATLAGLLLEPRVTNPDRVPGAVGARRNEVLRELYREGVIDAGALRTALREPLAFQPGVEDPPVTRPVDWERELEVIQLPVVSADTAAADTASTAAGTER